MPAAIKTGKKVWRECEECCGEGGYWADVYERTLGPPTQIESMMEQAQAVIFKNALKQMMRTSTLMDLIKG